jgi:diguanylate cyclase (GGDEF)-like protein
VSHAKGCEAHRKAIKHSINMKERIDVLTCAMDDGVWSEQDGTALFSRKFIAMIKANGPANWVYSPDLLDITSVFVKEDADMVGQAIANLRSFDAPFSLEVRMDNGIRKTWFRISGRSFVSGASASGTKILCGTMTSIHAHKLVEEEVNDIAMFTIENPYPVFRMTTHGIVMIANEAATPIMSVWGIGIGGKIPASITQLVMSSFTGEDGDNGRAEMEFACGEHIFSMNFVNHHQKGYVNVYCMDVTERERANRELDDNRRKLSSLNQNLKQQEERMRHMAQHDALTGLPNRALFYDRLSVAMEQAKRHRKIIAVMMLDLDKFKLVNDTLGHAVGDELLIAVAKRMSSAIRASDTVARIGGDEFMVLLNDISNEDSAIAVAEKILSVMEPVVETSVGVNLHATPSIGVAFWSGASDVTMDDFCAMSDVAMYHAKRGGRNTFRVFDESMSISEDPR